MARNSMQRGPITQRVAENVRALRKERGLDLEDVANELAAIAWPISVSTLSKLELGQRRADVDDLVALAVVLDVSPNRLLLPATARRDEATELTPDMAVSEFNAWEWATGDGTLMKQSGVFDWELETRVGFENRPHNPPSKITGGELFDNESILRPVVDAVVKASAETGWTRQDTLEASRSILAFVEMGEALAQKGEG